MGCTQFVGKKLYIKYDCVGKGTEEILTRETAKLRESLEKATKRLGITFKEINEVSYSFEPINIEKTIKELGISNGGVVSIKLKSTFNK